MKRVNLATDDIDPSPEDFDAADLGQPLVSASAAGTPQAGGVVIGEVVGIANDGATALVVFPGMPGSAAKRARSVVDLHGSHVGRHVVLMFEGFDRARPIVIGVVRGAEGWPADALPGRVEVDADGHQLVVSAKDKLVLRCGKAKITLTKAGKVLIEGTYVSSRATGVNRVKGGSVQLN
jgi:hypothetical protein